MVFAAEIEPRSELLDLGGRAVWCAPGRVARCDEIAVPDASFACGGGDRADGQVLGVAERADPMVIVGESDAEPGANLFGQMPMASSRFSCSSTLMESSARLVF